MIQVYQQMILFWANDKLSNMSFWLTNQNLGFESIANQVPLIQYIIQKDMDFFQNVTACVM